MISDRYTNDPDLALYPQLWDGCFAAFAPFLGPQGNALYDWSGFSNHLTLTGTTADLAWAQDLGQWHYNTNGADWMSGTGRYGSLLAGSTAATVCGWVKIPANGNPWCIGCSTSGKLVTLSSVASNMFFFLGSGGNSAYIGGVNGWSFVAGTWYGGSFTTYVNMKIFSNSVWVGGQTSFNPDGGSIGIGRDLLTTTYSTSGTLFNDVRLYNRALNADELALLYGNGYGIGTAYLLADNIGFKRKASGRLLSLRRKVLCA